MTSVEINGYDYKTWAEVVKETPALELGGGSVSEVEVIHAGCTLRLIPKDDGSIVMSIRAEDEGLDSSYPIGKVNVTVSRAKFAADKEVTD